MVLRFYDVNRSTIQFHEKLLPAQEKSDKCFQTNKELGQFLFFSSELPYKSLFTEELEWSTVFLLEWSTVFLT